MIMICKDGSYVFEDHKDLESVQNHLKDFSVLCIVEVSKVFCGDADILLMEGKIKVILQKQKVLVENEGMAWEFTPEKGWDLLGTY